MTGRSFDVETASGRLSRAIDARARILSEFLRAEGERLAGACHELARAFSRGGTLYAFGSGPACSDAAHVAVEFMHPVIVGKRALPAVALGNDPSGRSLLAHPPWGRDDVLLVLVHGDRDPVAEDLAGAAGRAGALTLGMSGELGSGAAFDYQFAVPCRDPQVVQEVQETAYHVLWELVHVFFEHPGLLAEACITCGDVAVEVEVVEVDAGTAVVAREGSRETIAVDLVEEVRPGDRLLAHAGVALQRLQGAGSQDATGFLYPFLERNESDLDAVLADVRSSTIAKGADAIGLRQRIDLAAVERAGLAVRARLERGGRLLAFGNGGSATDAQDIAADTIDRGHPAIALVNDISTVTAIANDVGFDNVFSRQLIPLAREPDVAVGISTSGSSANILAALEEAHRRGLLTIAIAGYGGGRCAELEWLDHLLLVDGDYVPRLQEAQATIYHLLLEVAA